MKNRLIMVALLLMGFVATSQANNIFDVLVSQKISIDNAFRYGNLTAFEARNLMSEQTMIERAILKAERDGIITNREYARITRLQYRAGQNIWDASRIGAIRINSINQRNIYNNNNRGNCRPAPPRVNRTQNTANIPRNSPRRIRSN